MEKERIEMRKVAESTTENPSAIWDDLKTSMVVQDIYEQASGLSAQMWYDPDVQTSREATDDLRGRDDCDYASAGWTGKYESWGIQIVKKCLAKGCIT